MHTDCECRSGDFFGGGFCHVRETGLYYYGKRYYVPVLRRWLTRDPIEEEGGINLYLPCNNSMVQNFDLLGMDRYMTQLDIGGVFGSGGTQGGANGLLARTSGVMI